ncbi:hypothetical protein QP880_09405 [Dermabacter hominis]|nr:hypothetical protein [Dermabacter hominis]MDK8804300.1 hypothetical protein [Dermabacter hominis]
MTDFYVMGELKNFHEKARGRIEVASRESPIGKAQQASDRVL